MTSIPGGNARKRVDPPRRRRPWLGALLALLLGLGGSLGTGAGGAGADGTGANSAPVGEVVVHWDADAAAAGGGAAARWGAVRAAVAGRLGFDPDLRGVEVFVVRGAERLREVAHADTPPWAGGVTVGGTRIVVRADAQPGGPFGDVESTLRHECVHLLWARHAGPRARDLPLWFEEGLAEEIGGAMSVSAGARLVVAAGTGRLLDFATLERQFPQRAEEADLAYQQSRSWFQFLVARSGWTTVALLLERLSMPDPDGASAPAAVAPSRFARALLELTRHPLSDWHSDWQRSFQDRPAPWWLWLVDDVGNLLWFALALVSAALFFVVRGRRRRQIAALPDDGVPPGEGRGGGRPDGVDADDPEWPSPG